jgi:hypothetical protein
VLLTDRTRYYRRMPIDISSLARAGAQSRIAELQIELEELRRAFPDVVGAPGHRGRGRPHVTESDGQIGAGQPRKRKGMSSAQKRAVGERMRAYWANRRRASGNTPADVSEQTTQTAPRKRVMSAEAREKIATAQRKRWRAVKRAGKKR